MRLIGMLDSPFVRRAAVSMKSLGVPFTHESVSVFRHFEHFASINPVVKAPSLITDEGVVLMDSTLIIDHAERLAAPGHSLLPADIAAHAHNQRLVGLALAACEKTVQIVYEYEFRPEEKRYAPWLERVRRQLLAAYGLIEAEIGDGTRWLIADRPMQADITIAIAWTFTQNITPGEVAKGIFPAIERLTARAEELPEFRAFPYDG